MADSLREAAEAVVQQYVQQSHGCHPSAGLCIAIVQLESSLSAPDQVAEAREILKQIIDDCDPRGEGIDEYNCIRTCELAREWLQRNGDAE